MRSSWTKETVGSLVKRGVLARPMDGNHGEIHPKSGDFVSYGIPFITASDLRDRRVELEGCKFISEEQAYSLRKGFSVAGDVLLSHKATLGRVAMVPELDTPFVVLTPQVTYYRVLDQDVLKREYLRYYLTSSAFQNELLAHSTGSTRGYISINRQTPLPILLPPLPEQRRIAAVLGALDDKIELNRKMNRTLEEMAQAIFKSWFIDFDGVPDSEMVDSELGRIPKGWEVRPLDAVADFLNGAACQKYRPSDGAESLPVVKIRELNQGITAKTDRATIDIPKKWWVEDGDVLFSWSGSLVVKVWTGGRAALNQHLFKVTSEVYPRWFYLLWTKFHLARFQRIAADKATTMGHIKRRHLSDALCVVPPGSTVERWSATLAPLVQRAVTSELESRTLAMTRDALLPKLISGELRVPDAEGAP